MKPHEAKRDHYRRLAKEQGYRSRSAYKLKQLKAYRIIGPGFVVLDLGWDYRDYRERLYVHLPLSRIFSLLIIPRLSSLSASLAPSLEFILIFFQI